MRVCATVSAMSVPFSTQSQRFVDGSAGASLQNRNYRGLAEFGNRASRRRINSTALSIPFRNAFSLAGEGRRFR